MNDLVSDKGFADFIKPILLRYPDHGPWTLLHSKNFVGLYVAEKEEKTGIPEILMSDDFVAFADLMRQTYRMDILREADFGLDIYNNPALLARWRDPKNAELYTRLDKIFSFKSNWVDIEELERIGQRQSLDHDLEQVQTLIEILEIFYPERYNVSDLHLLNDWLQRVDDPLIVARTKAFTEPKVVAFDVFLRKHFNMKLPMDDVSIAFAHAFGEKPEDLLILKKFLPEGQLPFNVDAKEIRDVLSSLEKKSVQKMVQRLQPDSWTELETTIELARHPHAEEILSMVKTGDGGRNFYDIKEALEISKNRIVWSNLKRLKKECPGSAGGLFGNPSFLEWFGKETTTKLFQKGGVKKTYTLLRDRWNIKEISNSNLVDILNMPEAKRSLLADDHFRRKVLEAHALLAPKNSLNPYDLENYLTVGMEGLDRFLSPESRSFIVTMRAGNPHFRIDLAFELNTYQAILVSKETQPFLDLIESGILGDKGLVKGLPPSFRNFKELRKKKLPLPFLKKLAAEGSVSISSIQYLPELAALSEVPHAAETLASLAQILGHPITDDTDWLTGRAALDELIVAAQMTKREGATEILGNPLFQSFCKRIATDVLVPPVLNIMDVNALMKTYKQKGTKMVEETTSESFKNMVAILRRDFNITMLRANMLPQLIDISRSYNATKVKTIGDRLGKKPKANDIVLLSRVAKDPAMEKLLFDREALEAEAKTISQKQPQFRKMINETKKEPPGYSERSPIEELDNLSLLRLALLKRALENPKTLEELGKIVAKDIADKKTEYGGILLFKVERLRFNGVSSLSNADGAYASPLNGFLQGGVMTYHLHALEENMSQYSGPSGYVKFGGGGDWAFAKTIGGTDVVITTCSRVEGTPNELWVNLDMYYYDDEGKGRIVDLGMFRVPAEI